jgi:sugar (pentulose or hexulose) kinase
MQILADVLNLPITASGEDEASARGAALLALRALGRIRALDELPASPGETFTSDPTAHEIYSRARKRHESLYHLLLESSPPIQP